jgi:hypothetical protein
MIDKHRIQIMKQPVLTGYRILLVGVMLMVAISGGDCAQNSPYAEKLPELVGTNILRFKIVYPELPPVPATGSPESNPDVIPQTEPDKPDRDSAPPALAETPSPDPGPSENRILSHERPSATVDSSQKAIEPAQPADLQNISDPPPKDASKTVSGQLKKITNIRFRTDSNGSENVMIVLNGFYPPEVSTADSGAPRIICDFQDVRLAPGVKRQFELDGKFIRRIRTGIHVEPARKTRIVLDLAPSLSYEVEQLFYQKDNTYSLKIRLKTED